MTKPIKNTLTLVDAYSNSHIIHKFGDNTIKEAIEDIINILRYAGFSESTIAKGLDEANLDF